MSWVQVDDRFDDHPKFVDLSDAAGMAWLRALAHCNRHLTDGAISPGVARRVSREQPSVVAELVSAGLWDEDPPGYRVHDFLDWNTPKEKRLKAKANAKDRKERFEERRRMERALATAPPAANDVAPCPTGTRSERVPSAARTASERSPKPSQAEEEDQIVRPSVMSKEAAEVVRMIGNRIPVPAERTRLALKLEALAKEKGHDLVAKSQQVLDAGGGGVRSWGGYLVSSFSKEATEPHATADPHDNEERERKRLGKGRAVEVPKVDAAPWDELDGATRRMWASREAYELRTGAPRAAAA